MPELKAQKLVEKFASKYVASKEREKNFNE